MHIKYTHIYAYKIYTQTYTYIIYTYAHTAARHELFSRRNLGLQYDLIIVTLYVII